MIGMRLTRVLAYAGTPAVEVYANVGVPETLPERLTLFGERLRLEPGAVWNADLGRWEARVEGRSWTPGIDPMPETPGDVAAQQQRLLTTVETLIQKGWSLTESGERALTALRAGRRA